MKWTEGHIHVAMRHILTSMGWKLIAGEYPGGSDHDLYPLNIVDPKLARDRSPAPRQHSLGELIPDLIALRGRELIIAEAKVRYDEGDKQKLATLLGPLIDRFWNALEKFSHERAFPDLRPVRTLMLCPTLVFCAGMPAPEPSRTMSYLRIVGPSEGFFEGALASGKKA